MKRELLKQIDDIIMNFWNDKEIDNDMKFECTKKLQEVQMILQGENVK